MANLDEVKDSPNYKFVKGNICSPDLVQYVLRTEAVDTIMHFAAQTHVDNSFGNSFQFTKNNILGTHVLLEAAKIHGIKVRSFVRSLRWAPHPISPPPTPTQRFIHVSTDEVYGEGETDEQGMVEDHILEPTNPYAATKAGAEFLVKAYSRSFALPTIITRGNNVYGPHQYPEKLIPKFVNQLMRNQSLTLHGSGANTRNFLFVEDVARAFECILFKGKVGQVYNIGGTNELSNLQVARQIIEQMGMADRESELLTFVEDRAFNDLRYTVDSSKLAELGWREMEPWETGIKKTIEWYKLHSDRYGNIDQALVAHPRIGTEGL